MAIIKNPTIVVKGGGTDLLPYRISNLGNYSVSDSNITSLKKQAFYGDKQLTGVNFPNVTSIGESVFQNCENLAAVSIPSATSIGTYAFQGIPLTSVDFPLVTSIGSSAFYNDTQLTSINFPLVSSIGYGAFQGCKELTGASFPSATSIPSNAFHSCTKLTSVNFPLVTSIGGTAFLACTHITSASFPKVTSIGNNAFYGCPLTSITLGSNTVCTLSATNSIPASATQHITIYVPISLIGQYRIATNWSTLYNNGYISFAPIDGQLITTNVTNGSWSGDEAIANNGTATVTISENNGYDLPATVTVTGATYTYSSSTGVVSLSNPTGPVTISATCTTAPSGYAVSVLLNFVGQDASSDARARVYDDVNGNLLHTFDSVYDTPSANVTTTTGKIYILIDNTYIPYIESYSVSNGITFNSWLQGQYDVNTPSVWILFDVAADGSISVEGYTDYA